MKGYTLIEVLMVVAILTLIFVVGYANFREYERRQKVISVARQIKADLRLAQESAIAGKKPENNCDILEGYAFWLDPTTWRDYRIYVLCRRTGGTFVVQETASHSIKEPNILISLNPLLDRYVLPPTPLTPTGGIQFKALAMGTNIPSGGAVTLTVSGKTAPNPSPLCVVFPWLPTCPTSLQNVTITITPGGEIK